MEKIRPLLESITYPEKSVIIREGSIGDSMYVIVRGNVKVFEKGDLFSFTHCIVFLSQSDFPSMYLNSHAQRVYFTGDLLR